MYMYTYANVIIHTHTYTYTYIYIHVYIATVYMLDTCEMYRQVIEQTGPAAKHGRWQMVDSAKCNETFNEIQEKGRNGRRLRIWLDMSWPSEPRRWVSIGESMQTHLQTNHIDSVND